MGRAARTCSSTRSASARRVGTRVDRPADASRPEHEQHDLRAVPFAARRHRARTSGRRRLLRLLHAASSSTVPDGRTDPAVLGRRPSAAVLERRHRPVAERVLSARRRDLHDLPRDPHAPDVDRNPQLAAANNALCTRMPPGDRRALDGAHASPRRQRRQLVRRVPHAEDGDQHQGDDARPHDQPSGAREHRRVRHPQRLHRMPRRQEGGVGRRLLDTWWPQGRRLKLVTRAEAFTAARAERPEALDGWSPSRPTTNRVRSSRRMRSAICGGYKDPRAAAALLAAPQAGHPAIRSAWRSRAWDSAPPGHAATRAAILARARRSAARGPHLGARVAHQSRRCSRWRRPIAALPPGRPASSRLRARSYAGRCRIQRDLGSSTCSLASSTSRADALQISARTRARRPSTDSCWRSHASASAAPTKRGRC